MAFMYQKGSDGMIGLDGEVAVLKKKGLGPESNYLLIFEAREMDQILALIERLQLSAKEIALVRTYTTLSMASGTQVDQIIRDLERILSMKG